MLDHYFEDKISEQILLTDLNKILISNKHLYNTLEVLLFASLIVCCLLFFLNNVHLPVSISYNIDQYSECI